MTASLSQRLLDKATRFAHSRLKSNRKQDKIVLRVPAHWALVMIDTGMQHKLFRPDDDRFRRSGHRLEENGRTLIVSYCREKSEIGQRRLDVGLLQNIGKGMRGHAGIQGPGPQWESYRYTEVEELEIRLTTLSKYRTGFAGSYRAHGRLIKDVWPWPLNVIIEKYSSRTGGDNG